jgi:ornithine cyclodeaminase
VIAGRVLVPAGRTVVFSPFGLGVLDLAVGKFVYDQLVRSGDLLVVEDFFHERNRYGPAAAPSTASSVRRRRPWSPRRQRVHSSGIRLMR